MDENLINERIISEAQFMIETNATIRATAKKFGLSKSAVHKDLSYKLQYVNERLYKQVKSVLLVNLKERHLRGGNATKRKFMRLKSKQQ
ncbi:MAG: sporulation transcriptional regulator SpoIIID [Clostridia bacterium]|nr:sporulation transcriptional regulator SpoIIID [Clostridia bacterium]